MTPQIRLAPHQVDDLRTFCGIGVDALKRVVEQFKGIAPLPTGANTLVDSARELLGDDEQANSLVRQALFVNGLVIQAGLQEADVAAGVRSALEREAKWGAVELSQWDDRQPVFLLIASSRVVRHVANAINLSYEFANLYRRARLITDVRPLFDATADAIDGALITFTLRLRFDSVEGDHGLSIAMDEADVKQLLEQCQRALKKSRTAQKLLHDKVKLPAFIIGESDDE